MTSGRLLLALLAGAALTSCGPRGGDRSAGAPAEQAAVEAAPSDAGEPAPTDPCARNGAFGARLCESEALAPLVRDIDARLAERRAQLSAAGKRVLAESLSRWAEAQQEACAAESENAADVQTCLKTALEERLESAQTDIEERGGFTFQRVRLVDAVPVPEGAGPASMGDLAPAVMVQDVSFPRIDNPEGVAAIDRFNDLVAQKPLGRGGSPSEQTVGYTIAFASPQLVSVRFDSSEYSLGAAHPNSGMRAVNVLMSTGEAVRPQDVFRAGSGWETFLTQRSIETLSAAFEEFGAGPPAEADVRETATKPHNWVIAQDGLTLLFPPYSIGPYAFGAQEVTIAWKELRPYVNRRAPAPIGSG